MTISVDDKDVFEERLAGLSGRVVSVDYAV